MICITVRKINQSYTSLQDAIIFTFKLLQKKLKFSALQTSGIVTDNP